jgi:putative RecB family exonuclease
MGYPISATKLRTYQRCPYAYYLRYEKRVSPKDCYGSAALGNALHQALAQCHRDWHYYDAIPDRRWVHQCWDNNTSGLMLHQVREGRAILDLYYDRFIKSEPVLRQPLAVEGKIQATLEVQNLEFTITGRYDRIDFLPDGLELIDYKSSREVKLPDHDELDLQIGLYYIALEQTYQQSLKYLSLLFLRTGEKVRYPATPHHQRRAQQVISQLALQLRHDQDWQPNPGTHCDRCSFRRYCTAVNRDPSPLPTTAPTPSLQLAFSL